MSDCYTPPTQSNERVTDGGFEFTAAERTVLSSRAELKSRPELQPRAALGSRRPVVPSRGDDDDDDDDDEDANSVADAVVDTVGHSSPTKMARLGDLDGTTLSSRGANGSLGARSAA
jgi:hypothetical protein